MQRVGFGYDSHRFCSGRPLVLGGVRVEHDQGLAGHSDADAVLHAITDAVLGALGEGDIGELFPDTDPQWQGADSARFLSHAVALASGRGLGVVNVDVTVMAERPHLADARDAMRKNLARVLDVDLGAVSIKATRGEGLGPEGRGEAITVHAVALLAPVS